jgi:hypothetical protein
MKLRAPSHVSRHFYERGGDGLAGTAPRATANCVVNAAVGTASVYCRATCVTGLIGYNARMAENKAKARRYPWRHFLMYTCVLVALGVSIAGRWMAIPDDVRFFVAISGCTGACILMWIIYRPSSTPKK